MVNFRIELELHEVICIIIICSKLPQEWLFGVVKRLEQNEENENGNCLEKLAKFFVLT